MSFAIVFSLIQLLLLLIVVMMVPVSAAAQGRHLDVKEAGTVSTVQASDNKRPKMGESGEQSESVSRRGWYGSVVMPWNNQDMAWLKRGGDDAADIPVKDVDKRGWGNGIPPWMRHRVIVLPAAARRSAKL